VNLRRVATVFENLGLSFMKSRIGGSAKIFTANALIASNLFACASNVYARLPGPAYQYTGQVEIKLNNSARYVTAAVNGIVVADDAHTARIVVDNVPAGPANVQLAMGGRGYDAAQQSLDVIVPLGGKVTVVAAAPNVSLGQTIATTGLLVFEGMALIALAILASGNSQDSAASGKPHR
jgi:hypothetical protein